MAMYVISTALTIETEKRDTPDLSIFRICASNGQRIVLFGDELPSTLARLALVQAAGLDKLRGHEAERQQFWQREEEAIALEMPKVMQP